MTLRKKNGYLGKWHLPGGTVYYREAIEDSVKRIAKEELGVKVSIEKFLGYIEFFSEEKERGFGYAVSLVFLCRVESTKFILDNDVEKLDFFNKPPDVTVKEQKDFLDNLIKKNILLKRL